MPRFAVPAQVYGTLIELFDCRKELYTATEVVANQSLFHVVVSLRSCCTASTHSTAWSLAIALPIMHSWLLAHPANLWPPSHCRWRTMTRRWRWRRS